MLSRKRTLLIIAISALLVLSACTMEVHSTFEKDGSGEFSLSFLISNADLSTFMGLYGAGADIAEEEMLDYVLDSAGFESIEDMCAGLLEEIGEDFPDANTDAKETSDGLECKINVPFESIEEYKEIQEINALEVELTEDTFSYRLKVGDVSGELEQLLMAEEYGLEVSFLWKVTTPGKISDHNGTSVSGNTVTWDLLELDKEGSISHMEVTSSTSGGGGMDINTIIIIAVVVVVVIFLVIQQKKSKEEV